MYTGQDRGELSDRRGASPTAPLLVLVAELVQQMATDPLPAHRLLRSAAWQLRVPVRIMLWLPLATLLGH